MLKRWEDLPDFIRVSEVRPYYDLLNKKKSYLIRKRVLDVIISGFLLGVLAIPMLIIAICIKLDSKGPVFYRQERVTLYCKRFKIHKFRTMVENADRIGESLTTDNDSRITKIGRKIRGLRLDEIPQLIDVIQGTMSFVGTRPEDPKYVDKYDPEYRATLLLPAGITSEASIHFKDEDKLLCYGQDIDNIYLEKILPQKMKWNLKSLENLGTVSDLRIMMKTLNAVTK